MTAPIGSLADVILPLSSPLGCSDISTVESPVRLFLIMVPPCRANVDVFFSVL
jgi:hypothetical protein